MKAPNQYLTRALCMMYNSSIARHIYFSNYKHIQCLFNRIWTTMDMNIYLPTSLMTRWKDMLYIVWLHQCLIDKIKYFRNFLPLASGNCGIKKSIRQTQGKVHKLMFGQIWRCVLECVTRSDKNTKPGGYWISIPVTIELEKWGFGSLGKQKDEWSCRPRDVRRSP